MTTIGFHFEIDFGTCQFRNRNRELLPLCVKQRSNGIIYAFAPMSLPSNLLCLVRNVILGLSRSSFVSCSLLTSMLLLRSPGSNSPEELSACGLRNLCSNQECIPYARCSSVTSMTSTAHQARVQYVSSMRLIMASHCVTAKGSA